tara:strand:- start:833 stop:946 length:114 start_codon:yes stop_codon:yes gene_type:complete
MRKWLMNRQLRKIRKEYNRVVKVYPKKKKDDDYGGDD